LRSTEIVILRSEPASVAKDARRHHLTINTPPGRHMPPKDLHDRAPAGTDTDRFVVITGCSGGGKSTLLVELARRGFTVVPEAGRQIVREQDRTGGDALPWTAPTRFAELAVSWCVEDLLGAARAPGPVFLDRSPIDQLAGLERLGLPVPDSVAAAAARYRYNATVFVAPPWPEIFVADAERRHGFDEALAEYGPLRSTYARLGYRLVDLPKTGVAARADFVLERLR
jgi:predicted ATPase